MKRFTLIIALLFVTVFAHAQGGTAPALGTNNVFTANNTFNAGVILTWQSTTTYAANAEVTYMGANYISVSGGNLNNTPPNPTFWTPVSGSGSPGGVSGNGQTNNGSGGFAGVLFPTYNTADGALNNGSTDDATANNACVNGLATNGGTCLIGNNSLWTPPTIAWNSPNYWETISLQGKITLKTNPLDLGPVQALTCVSPVLNSANDFFSYSPGCEITPQSSSVAGPILSFGVNSETESGWVSNIRVSGYQNRGIYDCVIDDHLTNVFSLSATSSGAPYETCRKNGHFGTYMEGGGFECSVGSTNPSILWHSMGVGVLNKTFLNGCGMYDETTSFPPIGQQLGGRSYLNMLYENAPAWTNPACPFHTYDVTGGATFANEFYVNPIMSDAADGICPMIKIVASSSPGEINDTVFMGLQPTGPYFNVPTGFQRFVDGVTILGGNNRKQLGLYSQNAIFTILNGDGASFNNGGGNGFTSASPVAGFGVGLSEPQGVACSASNSGGTSLPAGTYYLQMAYVDNSASPGPYQGQPSYEVGPFTVTGSSGSIGCSYTASNNSIIGGVLVDIGTAPSQENIQYSFSNSGSFTVATSGTAATILTQMFINPATMSYSSYFGKVGGAGSLPRASNYSGTDTCFAFGKNGCTSDTTPGDVQVAGSLTVTGTCTGCNSGSVSTTGSPASGNLTKFSGAATITNGDLAGDVTTSGTLNATVVGVNGATPPASAAVVGTNSSKQIIAATGHGLALPTVCADTSGSGTTQVCNTTPTFTPVADDTITYTTTTANTGDVTVNVNSLGAKHIRKWQGSGTLASGDLAANTPMLLTYDGMFWEIYTIGNSPAGTGTVTSIATTAPLGGGTITSTGTLTCTTCLVGSSLTAGVVHAPGSSQTMTSGTVALATEVSGQLAITHVGSAGLSGTAPISAASTGAISCTTCTVTIFSGTAALGTSAISSGTCATVVTVSASGVATTDNISADFNADPTSTVGYQPSTSGTLTIIKYPTANNINVKVCNSTASSITPGAVTLNLRVTR